jgi:hypothetical protein
MVKLKSETHKLSRRRRFLSVLILMVLVVVGTLVVERWRGQWALKGWKRQMAAKGEIFDAERLWPPFSARSLAFSNRLAQAIGQLPPRLASYAGLLSGIVQEQPGQARRGSQERYPPMAQKVTSTNTWQDLDAVIGQARPALESLHQLMKDPPPDMGYDIMRRLGTDSFPNFVNVRRSAQALQAAAMNDLHKGNLPGALENLTALSRLVKLYAADPALVSLMIRVAITGLSVDLYWDALQAEGWTEPQLATLQQACQDDDLLLVQMSRALEAERVIRTHDLAWFRSHSYGEWVARYQKIFQSFGWQPSTGAAGPVGCWRQCVFHPLWKFAWADQEELIYLQTVQGEVMDLREAAKNRSWLALNQQMAAHYQNYHPPIAAWRFYVALPLYDEFRGVVRGSGDSPRNYPYAVFSRAWSTTMKNMTLHQMVIAATALKRYELRQGQPPQSLASLVPEFLAKLPHDFMDGQPLRYRLNGDGSFALYSVGEDGQDDGGDPSPAVSDKKQQTESPWAGRDWVWPRAAGAKAGRS